MAAESNFAWKRQRVVNMIATNNSELVEAEGTARRCRERHYALKTVLNSNTSLMLTLPLEVLSEIFVAACYCKAGYFNSNRLPMHLVIGKVCKSWRELAWATPRLWCQVLIVLKKERWEAQKRLLEEWVARSGNCLALDLNITTNSLWEPPRDAFEVIINSCHRWKTLICGAFASLSFALESKQILQFPLLETLEFKLNKSIKAPLKKWNFHYPPRLESLDIRSSLSDYGLAVNWSILTELTADVVMGPRLAQQKACIPLHVLATCQSLVYLNCNLYTAITDPTHVFYPTTICFPFLESLNLQALPRSTTQFMAMTKLPALKALSVDTQGRTSSEDATWTTAMIDWAKRSAFRLEILSISTENLTEDLHIANMLRSLSPSNPIRTLSFACSGNPTFHLSDNMISQLTMRPKKGIEHQKVYLSALTRFLYRGNISFSISAMICLLKSRMAYAKLLKDDSLDAISTGYEYESGDDEDDEDGNHNRDKRAMADEDPQKKKSNETSSFLGALEIGIVYSNRKWFQKQFPNHMRAFYRAVEDYVDGISFTCEWDGCEDSDDE